MSRLVGWEAILAFLQKIAPREVNAWAISVKFDMTQAAARQALHRLTLRRPPVVYQPKPGFYASTSALAREKTPYDDFLRLGFHGIEAIADCHKWVGGVNRNLRQVVTARYASPTFRRNPANRSLVYDGDWDGRPLTIQLTTQDKLMVSLKASDFPLDLLDFFAYLRYLDEFFKIPRPLWTLRFDLNEDHEGRLETAEFRWSEAIGFVRIYWKKRLEQTRVEARDYRGITLETLLPAVERVLDALLELEAP